MKVLLIIFVIISVINFLSILTLKEYLDIDNFILVDTIKNITRITQIMLGAVIVIVFIVGSGI